MLTISPSQYNTFESSQIQRFLESVSTFLRENLPERYAANCTENESEKLCSLMRNAIGFGLTTEQQIAGYVLLAHVFGLDFAVNLPWAATILTDNNLDGDTKLARLRAAIG